ncbi:MAG: glycosyltransferase family A protein [Cetobacterium sp.]
MVSLIIPCFNGEKFIERCLESILNQTYKNLEIIIINDGSYDDSEKKIKKYIKKFVQKNIKIIYIYQKNLGVAEAINKGLKVVSGKYLSLLDIDDYLMPNSVELKVKFLEENLEYDLVRTNGYYVDESDLDNNTNLFITNLEEKKNIYIFEDLLYAKTNNWAGSYLVRVDKLFSFYKDRKIYASRYGQNLQILLPLSKNGKSGFIDIPLMKYIKQDKSLSSSLGDMEIQKNFLGYKDIRKYMINLIFKNNYNEKQKYLYELEVNYARYFIYLGVIYKNRYLLEENYKKLKKYKAIKIEDRIEYYSVKNKVLYLILMAFKKIRDGIYDKNNR